MLHTVIQLFVSLAGVRYEGMLVPIEIDVRGPPAEGHAST
jgi:hypothetical protein